MSKNGKTEPQGELPEVKPVQALTIALLNTGQFAINYPRNSPDDFNTAITFLTQGLMIINQEMAKAKTLQQSRIVKPNMVLPKNLLRPEG